MIEPWQARAVNIVLALSIAVALVVLYVAFVQRGQSSVLSRVDEVTQAQHGSAQSTECAREVNSAGEVVQLEALENLSEAFLDLTADNTVGEQTRAEVAALIPRLEAAQAAYEGINDRCPVPDG